MSHNAPARAAIRSYTTGLYRAITRALIEHMPDKSASPGVHDACRTMAVGVLAETIARLISAAPDHADKGGRAALRRMAHDLVNTAKEPAPALATTRTHEDEIA